MESTRLISSSLSSTPLKSKPIHTDGRRHRPSPSGSVPSFRLEGSWDGLEADEHAIDNSEPLTARRAASTPPKKWAPGDARSRWAPARWPAALGALAAFAGVLVLFALPGGHHRQDAALRPSLSGVGMPTTLPGNVPVKPLRIAVVLGEGMPPPAQIREINTLENWLTDHVNPATRMTIVNVAAHTATPTFRPFGGETVLPDQRFRGMPDDVLRRRLSVGQGRRLIVAFDRPDLLTKGGSARLNLVSRPGADLPSAIALRPGDTTTAAVDPDEIHAFANSTAKAVVSISNMREGHEE
jgi:hypothetical protein